MALMIARPIAGKFFGVQPNAIVVRDLRVAFTIQKHLGKEPNTCSIIVSNLAERSRAELQKKPLFIRLEAGYDGQLAHLFGGDMRWSESTHEGTDWTTKIEVADGDRAYRHARVNRSFGPGIRAKDGVKETIGSMGLPVPSIVDKITGLASQYVSGLALQGKASTELTRLLKPHGADWSIQDGQIQILRETDVRSNLAWVISQDAGMIGSPAYGAPPQKGQAPILHVKCLLFPALTPGGKVQIKSETVNGVFRLESVRHTGDTHGEDWYSELECKALPGQIVSTSSTRATTNTVAFGVPITLPGTGGG